MSEFFNSHFSSYPGLAAIAKWKNSTFHLVFKKNAQIRGKVQDMFLKIPQNFTGLIPVLYECELLNYYFKELCNNNGNFVKTF